MKTDGSKLNVYKAYPEIAKWIDNDECIIVAKNLRDAKKLLKKQNIFRKDQGQITIELIDLTQPEIICISNVGA